MWIYIDYLMDKYDLTEEEATKVYEILKRNNMLKEITENPFRVSYI